MPELLGETLYAVVVLFLFSLCTAVYVVGRGIQTMQYKEWLRAKILQEEGNKRFWREDPENAARLGIPKEE